MVELVSIAGAWFSAALVVGFVAGPALRSAGVAADRPAVHPVTVPEDRRSPASVAFRRPVPGPEDLAVRGVGAEVSRTRTA